MSQAGAEQSQPERWEGGPGGGPAGARAIRKAPVGGTRCSWQSGWSGEVAAPAGPSCQGWAFGQSSGSGEQMWMVLPNYSRGGDRADVYWPFPPCTQLSPHAEEVRSSFPPFTGEETGAQGGNVTCSGSHSIWSVAGQAARPCPAAGQRPGGPGGRGTEPETGLGPSAAGCICTPIWKIRLRWSTWQFA